MRIPYYGAGILFYAEDKSEEKIFLLGQRRFRPYRGYFSIPGGGAESDDHSLWDTAIREATEELGEISEYYSVERYFEVDLRPLYRFRTYVCRIHAVPSLSEWPTRLWQKEFSKIAWFNVGNLPPNTHGGIRRIIRKLT